MLLTYLHTSDATNLTAAKTIGALLEPHPLLLSPESFAVTRILYKQKFFSLLQPSLVRDSKSPVSTRRKILVAFAGIVKDLPNQLVVNQVSSLVPILFEALSISASETSSDDSIHLSTLKTLTSLLESSSSLLESHLDSLVFAVMDLTVPPSGVLVRVAALNVLAMIPARVPVEIVYPVKERVLEKLDMCLDDRKRVVRGQAVKALGSWNL